jgi:membrane protease YdiL (CAAX protease family)
VFILLITASASLAVWAAIVSRWLKGRPALEYRERAQTKMHGIVVLAVGLIWFGARLLLGYLFGFQEEVSRITVLAICASNALTLASVACILKLLHGNELAGLGLRFDEPPDEARNGALGFLASVLPVLLVVIATQHLRSDSDQHAFLKLLRADRSVETLVWIMLAVILLAPLTEELLFRVILQGSLQSRVAPGYAIVLTALLFSAIHGWPDSLGLIPLALILGYVFYRRNSYLAVVILHALFNLSNLLMALLED